MKGRSVFVGVVAAGVFLAAYLLTVQVRGDVPSPVPAAPEPGIELCLPPDSPETSSAPRGGTPPAGLASTIQGEPVVKLLPVDAIASVDEPRMVPADEAEEFMRDDELVIGVVVGEEARAYSTWHLDHHEIVNDRLGETPIAATW